MPLLIAADRPDRLLADNLERTMSRHLVWNFTPGLSARSVALSYSGPHHALHDQFAIAWSSADCVAEAASLITAEELDGMSPDERARVVREHIGTDLAQVPDGFRRRVETTAARLAEQLRLAAE